MRKFWSGLSSRAKWVYGVVAGGLGWLAGQFLGSWAVEWSVAALKTKGAKRMIALVTLFLAAHPFATFCAVVSLAILAVVLLAYRDSRSAAKSSELEDAPRPKIQPQITVAAPAQPRQPRKLSGRERVAAANERMDELLADQMERYFPPPKDDEPK